MGICRIVADGYARSGKAYGVAIGTAGPGAAHLFTAVSAAWQDSSPVLFIAGQVKTSDSSKIQIYHYVRTVLLNLIQQKRLPHNKAHSNIKISQKCRRRH